MRSTLLATLALALSAFANDTLPERRGLEIGEFKRRAPEVQDRLLGPEPAHQDDTGSCEQVVLAVAGAEDGRFGAIWRDRRQGNMGLYLGIVTASGEVRGEEKPAYPNLGTARQLQPDLAFTHRDDGILCWRTGISAMKPIQVRGFGGAPGFRTAPVGFGAPPEAADLDPRSPVGRGDGGGRSSRGAEPHVAALGGGRGLVAWTQGGAALAQAFDEDAQPIGETMTLDPGGAAPTDAALVAGDGDGVALVVWPTSKGMRAWLGASDKRALRGDVGAGQLLAVEHDPAGGWWLLVQPDEGAAVLRHLDGRARVDREDVALPGALLNRRAGTGDWSALDFAAWKHGLAVAATEARGERPVRLMFLSADGAFDGREYRPDARPGSLNALVAASGAERQHVLVAWTDDRHGDRDVFFDVLRPEPDAPLPDAPEARRWNTDHGSAAQSHPTVASTGSRARVVWTDLRSGTNRLWMRDLAVDRKGARWAGDDRPVPIDALDSAGEVHPNVALQPDGSGVVAWQRLRGGEWWIVALGPDGERAADARALGVFEDDVRLRPREDGYVLLARTKDGALVLQALDAAGSLAGERRVLAEKARGNVETSDLVQLADGRWIAVWTRHAGKRRQLEGAFLGSALEPTGHTVEFDFSGRGGDLQPALAPAKDGGFLMAWTAFDSRGRDVTARRFDGRGRAKDRPLGISPQNNEQDFAVATRLAGGDWVVVWEDDISRWDQIHACRVDPKGREMGEAVTLNGMEMSFTMGRTGPVMAPLGDGFVCAWVDRSRGLGPDVFVTVVGPGFDEL